MKNTTFLEVDPVPQRFTNNIYDKEREVGIQKAFSSVGITPHKDLESLDFTKSTKELRAFEDPDVLEQLRKSGYVGTEQGIVASVPRNELIKAMSEAGGYDDLIKSYTTKGEPITKDSGIGNTGNIGYDVNPTTGLGADANGVGTTAALRVESLDPYLTQLSYGTDQFIFWRRVSRTVAKSTVEQYNVFLRHSQWGHGLAVGEGHVPEPTVPRVKRQTIPIKYVSKTTNVTVQSLLAASTMSPAQLFDWDAIVAMVSTIEYFSFYGDSSLYGFDNASGSANGGLEFDGLAKLIESYAPENIIDAKGEPLSGEYLNRASGYVQSAYRNPTDAFMTNGAKMSFVNGVADKNTIVQLGGNQASATGVAYGLGYDVPHFNDFSGNRISLNASKVLSMYRTLDTTYAQGTNTAADPQVTATVDSTSGKGSFREGHEVGKTLEYKVIAVSGKHQSYATPATAEITTPTDVVKLAIKVPALSENGVEYIEIYRKSIDSQFNQYYTIARLSAKDASDGKFEFEDTNATIAGTSDVFVGDMHGDVITMYELLPISSIPLAQLSASYTWSMLWFGALALKVPRAWVMIKNVKSEETSVQY